MNRSLTGLIATKALSDVGFALDFVCLSVFVWITTESVPATGALSVALYAGGIVGGQLGHRYGAHWDRRRAMVTADLARMAALLLLAAAPGAVQLWLLFPAVLVVGTGRSVFDATLAAATPVLAGARVQLLNSVLSGIKGVALMIGMGLAAVAVPLIGFRGVFALDGLTYGLSAVAVLLLPLRLREQRPAGAAPAATAGASAKAVWPVVLGGGLVALLAVRGLDALGSASHHVGLPILGDRLDPANPSSVAGLVWMAWAVGTVAGSFGLRPLLRVPIDRQPAAVFYAATVVMSAGFIGVFWFGAWPAVLAAAAVAGLGDAVSGIAFRQRVQQLPDESRGPAFGLCHTVINAGFTVGLVITSVALVPEQVGEWVLLMHGVPMLAAAGSAVWLWARSGGRRPAGRAPRTETGTTAGSEREAGVR